jgi:hypothetical protein
MEYQTTVHFSGDSQRVLDRSTELLSGHGMRTLSRSSSRVELEGEAAAAPSDKDPLRSISRMTINVTGSSASVRAELGGVRKLFVILTALLVPTDLAAAIGVGLLLWKQNPGLAMLIAVGIVASTLLLLPVIRMAMIRQASRAIDKLLSQATSAA